MKLNKFKVGLIFTLLLSLFLAVSGFAAPEYVENTNTWIIDEQAEFDQLVGMKLSAVDFDGDGQPDIKAGDTLALGSDLTLFTQDASITIDLQNIAIEGNDNTLVIIEQETVGGEYGDYETVHTGYDEVTGSPITENVTSSIVIEEEGAQLRNLVFEPADFSQADGTPVDSNNAVLVNATDFCACGGRPMAIENVQMPECGSCCDFDYGFRFTGKVEDWGGRNTSYSNIDFKDVKIKGVSTNAIEFASSVGDVSNINLDKMYLGNSGACGQCEEDPENQGYGLYFTNNGALEDVTLENSNGLKDGGTLKDSEYGIENNTDGIRINGDYVTTLNNLHITDVDIQNNCDNGISIIGKWDPCADDIEGFTNSLIRSIDMTVENTEISGNGDPVDEVIEGHFDGGFGIFVGNMTESSTPGPPVPPPPPELVAGTSDSSTNLINYSSAKLDNVKLDNVQVFNNISGGAGLFATKVNGSSTSPALKVLNSRFNQREGIGDNDQAFGLTAGAWEGMNGVEISNSTFNDHDGHGDLGYILDGLPVQFLGDGIALLATYEDVNSDYIDNVTIKDTDAKNNGFESAEGGYGSGLRIEADTVDGVEVSGEGKFIDNVYHGMMAYAKSGLSDITVDGDKDSQGDGKIVANNNGGFGMFVGTDDGDVTDIDVTNAKFGVVDNGNGMSGVVISTLSSGSVGSSDSDSVVHFDNIMANDNRGSGMEIITAESFLNSSGNIVVNNSEFKDNHEDGLRIEAGVDIKNPRIEDSVFNGNYLESSGIYMKADEKITGSSGTSEIKGNIVAGNKKGISIASDKDPKEDEFIDRIENFSVKENTTVPNSDDYEPGNSEVNIELAAKLLNSVNVTDNRIIGNTKVGLRLQSVDPGANITATQNLFDSEAVGACIGEGTAIELDALDTDIKRNEFKKFATGVKVLQENSNDAGESAGDTSNHINENNMLECCITLDATELDADEKVDATDNFWGEDYQTPDSIKVNMRATAPDPLDQIFVEPLKAEKVEIFDGNVTVSLDQATEDPAKDETVEVDYEVLNNLTSSVTVDAQLKVTDPDENVVKDDQVLSGQAIAGDSLETGTVTFTPEMDGTYTVEMTVDDGSDTYKESIEIVVGEGPAPEDKEPYWGQNAEPAQSGITPAPLTGEDDPYLELGNESGSSVRNAVDVDSVKVFSLNGNRVLEIKEDFGAMADLNQLKNGLYLYTVEYSVDGGDTERSPVMKFLVKK